MTDNFESSYFRSILYMKSDTQAFIIIAYMYHSNRIRSTIRQAFHIKTSNSLFLTNEFHRYR